MKVLKQYGRFTLCEGIGHHWNQRYEIWEEKYTGSPGLRYWSSSKEIAEDYFEKIKDEPLEKRLMMMGEDLEEWLRYVENKGE